MSILEKFIQIIKPNKEDINARAISVIGDAVFSSYTEGNLSAESAVRISTVYSCIRVRAESIAALPMRLYQIAPDGSKTLAYNQPIYRLLHSEPNSWMTAAEFWELCCWCLDVYGNFYAYIVRVAGTPTEIIPLSNNSVSCEYITGTNTPQYIITLKSNDGKIRQVVCSEKDVLHIRLNAPDGLHGISPIGQVNRLMYNANATESLAGKVYQSGAITSGVLCTENKLDRETHKIIRDTFYNEYVGTANAGKPMILDGGLKYNQFKISLVDAQFIDSRKYDRDEICGVFRIPPHLVGNLDHATFSNIEQQNLQFINYSLAPYLRRIEQRVNKQIIPEKMRKSYRFKFDLGSLLRGDSNSQVNYVKSLLDSGIITINDALNILGMNTCSGGDIRKLPLNTAYMDSSGKIINPNTDK